MERLFPFVCSNDWFRPSQWMSINNLLILPAPARRFHSLFECFERKRDDRSDCQHWFRDLELRSPPWIGLSNKARTRLHIDGSLYLLWCMSDRGSGITERLRRTEYWHVSSFIAGEDRAVALARNVLSVINLKTNWTWPCSKSDWDDDDDHLVFSLPKCVWC